MSEYILNVPDYVPPFDPAVRAASLGEEVVRCRDCANGYEFSAYDSCYLVCKKLDGYHHLVEQDGFCAWGERRDA